MVNDAGPLLRLALVAALPLLVFGQVFQPADRAALKAKVDACAAESADFNCPNTIATANGAAIGAWDVSRVTEFNDIFSGYSSFNIDISGWDVSRGTTFQNMFRNCAAFNQPLNGWAVGKSTTFRGMFSGCTVFNQPLASWDTSKSTNFEDMFANCAAFNQPLNSWTVSSGVEFGGMFEKCTQFNQPLGSWDVSSGTGFRAMFEGCTRFNQPIGVWDVSAGTNFWAIFEDATAFTQLLSSWNVTDPLTTATVDKMFLNVPALVCTHVAASNTFSCGCHANYTTSDGVSCTVAGPGVFQPADRAVLKAKVDACAAESADFNCPNTIATANGAAIGAW
eukprot:COSAG01_NODE_10859_length_2066_cov_3.428571_1_plen_335_part_01